MSELERNAIEAAMYGSTEDFDAALAKLGDSND